MFGEHSIDASETAPLLPELGYELLSRAPRDPVAIERSMFGGRSGAIGAAVLAADVDA